jgi:hypothetical protein
MQELKRRELKQSVGTTWEAFCVDWLRTLTDKKGDSKYDAVYTLQEWYHFTKNHVVPEGLILGKKDIGIDLIAHNQYGYHAIQCKWRKKGKVTWDQLSTFIGLVARTGPWASHVIMTNGSGIMWRVKRTKKDVSICQGTFASTSRLHWVTISGGEIKGHTLRDGSEEPEIEETDLDKIREARLARFSLSVVDS